VNESYRVVLTGEWENGSDRATVASQMSALFGISPAQAEELLAGRETVIKKDVDAPTARRYEQAIRQVGAACRIEAMSGESGNAGPPTPEDPGTVQTSPPRPPPEAPPADDPFAPPRAALLPDTLDAEGIHAPARCPVGRGLGWVVEGAKLFANAPGVWILLSIVYILITLVGAFVPLIGPLALSILYPVFLGGIMIGVDRQFHGDGIAVKDLFVGFSTRFGTLAAIGAVYIGGSLGIGLLVSGIGSLLLGAGMMGMGAFPFGGTGMAGGSMAGPGMLIPVLLMLAALVPFYMAIWFAPTLLALNRDIGLWPSLALSYKGCARNFMAFLIYGLVILAVLVLGALPFGLGLLVAAPVLMASGYVSYREIYVD